MHAEIESCSKEPDDHSDEGAGKSEPAKAKGKVNEGNRLIAHIASIARPTQDESGRHFVTFESRPHEAIPHDGTRSVAMIAICKSWTVKHGKYPAQAARSMASDWLAGECATSAKQMIALRAAQVGDEVFIDTGWDTWEVIHVTAGGWRIASVSPVPFYRSPVSGAMADPRHDPPSTTQLSRFVRISPNEETVLLATLLMNWFTECPQPILVLLGSANVGKSLCQQFLLSLVDPTTVTPGNDLTSDPREFKALAAIRRTIVFDNASYVDPKVSDLLARVSTGGELVSRTLYTNDGAHITTLQRPVWLNGIMSGFSRSDLASRSVKVDLQSIPEGERIPASELKDEWESVRPAVTSALLDLLVTVLRYRMRYSITGSSHRNGDLIRVLKVLDDERNTAGLDSLNRSIEDLQTAVIDASPLAAGLQLAVECARAGDDGNCCRYSDPLPLGEWLTWDKLKESLTHHLDEAQSRKLPESAKSFGEALMRVSEDLKSIVGVVVERKRTAKATTYQVIDMRAGNEEKVA